MARKRRGRGEGSIYKRNDGLWAGSISLGYDNNGSRIRPTFYAKTKKEVREKLKQKEQDYLKGVPVNPGKITVDEHFQDWLKAKKPTIKQATFSNYYNAYKNHISPKLGHIPIKTLHYHQINSLYASLDEKGYTRMVSCVSNLLKAVLEDAVKKGIAQNNPAKLAVSRTQNKKEARYLNEEEIKKFLNAVTGERLEFAFKLALFTGLRPGEWLGLPWDAVDFHKKQIIVKQALHEDSGRIWIDTTKTNAGRRTLNLSKKTISWLKNQKKQQAQEQLASSKKWLNQNNLVFTTSTGKPLRRSNVGRRDFKRVIKRAGLKNVTLHSLRHTHAAMLISQDTDPKTICQRLGHENVAFTLQTYGHLFPGKDKQAAEKLDVFTDNL